MRQLPKTYQEFRTLHPKVYAAYESLGTTAAEAGPLDAKVRELIKLGMAAANGSESGVQSHVHRALESGATEDEIEHALLLGVNTLGFSRMMAALTWARGALGAQRN